MSVPKQFFFLTSKAKNIKFMLSLVSKYDLYINLETTF